ncbi:amidohydrolase [Treponema primitia]|uniref:amidohydrolase n=1 Tax=Treponema primitia TaxID=88058 RepID=UPI000255589D|nr:amidohydrolase [Treponema primitia]
MTAIEGPADQVWLNGVIYTVDNAFSKVSALAWKDGRIVYAGTDQGARAYIGKETKTEDLAGKTALPGFIDSHLHLQAYAEGLGKLRIRDLPRAEILDRVREVAKNAKPGEWILGAMGWNDDKWADPSFPTREELDAAAPDNPVMLPRMDGHISWCNSRAFEAAGVTDHTPDPPDGQFIRTPDGHLQGCASDGAARIIQYVGLKITERDYRKRALLKAQDQLIRNGITGVQDAGTSIELIRDLKELYASGEYKLRFSGALNNLFQPNADPAATAYFEQCPEIGLFDGRYTVRAVKLFADGSLGAQTAALYEDYSDRPGYRGILMYQDDTFYSMVKKAALQKMQVLTHAIGDAAISQTLNVYERVLSEIPQEDHRYRIEHFGVTTGNILERTRDLGILAAIQAVQMVNAAKMYLRRLGTERLEKTDALGLVQRTLGKILGGSDAPVDAPVPLEGIHAGVTRTNTESQPAGGFYPENALSRADAIRSYTIWGAYAQFAEKDRGSIEPGKRADLVLLDSDIMTVPGEDIHTIRILRTVINGETLFDET